MLARRNSTGCIAGISVAIWIPFSWHVLAQFFSHYSRFGAFGSPEFFPFSHFHNKHPFKNGIMTTDHQGIEKFDHLGVGTARATFYRSPSPSSGGALHRFIATHVAGLVSGFSVTDLRLDHRTGMGFTRVP